MGLLNILLVGFAVLLSIPVLVLALEIASAIVLGARVSKPPGMTAGRPRLAALVPAHNEGNGIVPTLADVRAQLEPGDRLLVVADNCSDDTAAVAREAGADVVERHDPDKRGKGHALAFGLRHLAEEPPDMVIVVDADCRLGENALTALTACCATTGRPAQAQYLLKAPVESGVGQSVAEFSWLLRNHVRLLGLAAMGLPCNVRGSGMVLPWRAALAVDLGGSNLVQDTRIGLDLAEKGQPAVYCPGAVIESLFPQSVPGTVDQRQRWELGTLQIIHKEVPRLLASALRQRSLGLVALALDTLVPPVVLLAALLVFGLAVTGVAALLGASGAAPLVLVLALGLLAGSVLAAWARFGRTVLPAHRALNVFPFLLQKLQIYRPLLTGQKTGWKRTHRD